MSGLVVKVWKFQMYTHNKTKTRADLWFSTLSESFIWKFAALCFSLRHKSLTCESEELK